MNRKIEPARLGLLIGVFLIFLFGCWFWNVSILDLPLVGDQASHLLQALSLANGLDLRFDANDLADWRLLDWPDNPNGLFFQQYSGGFAFAKPYGYSLYLAPFVLLLGGEFGPLVANASLLAILSVLCFSITRQSYSASLSILLALCFVFASNIYFYAFVIHPELFLATLVALFTLIIQKSMAKGSDFYAVLLAVLAAFLLAEAFSSTRVKSPTEHDESRA